MSVLDELWQIVATIPPGSVAAYGDVGRALSRPVSGVLVGKWMTNCPPDVPWWRVVGKKGDLLIGGRGPTFALDQRRKLEAEGVSFVDDRVATDRFMVP
ncbi:MAG: MGMT family protein [Armatimonadetes bacterium]|nr:MGMT family protein [Armatimonadota bacterium]